MVGGFLFSDLGGLIQTHLGRLELDQLTCRVSKAFRCVYPVGNYIIKINESKQTNKDNVFGVCGNLLHIFNPL